MQPSTSGPFTSSFGGTGFSDDPFKSKQDTPAVPPKKPAPPRPKPPSGQYASFSRSRLPTVAGHQGYGGPLRTPAQRVCVRSQRGSPPPVTWLCTPVCLVAPLIPPALAASCGPLGSGLCVGLQGVLQRPGAKNPPGTWQSCCVAPGSACSCSPFDFPTPPELFPVWLMEGPGLGAGRSSG